MNSNFHTHTYLCRHAFGEPAEYVENAIKEGMKILGFSDHAPYLFGNMRYYSDFRMKIKEAEVYTNEIVRLRDRYKSDIRIYVGYEMEYYPRHFRPTLEVLKRYALDYLILGQHFTDNEYDGVYLGMPTRDEAVLKRYVSQVTEAMETGCFTYLAHPDLPYFLGDTAVYRREMKKLCEAAKRYNIPLEFNLLGFGEKRHYPRGEFWDIVSETGNDVVIGCDAHSARAVAEGETESAAAEYLRNHGITTVREAALVKPV